MEPVAIERVQILAGPARLPGDAPPSRSDIHRNDPFSLSIANHVIDTISDQCLSRRHQ